MPDTETPPQLPATASFDVPRRFREARRDLADLHRDRALVVRDVEAVARLLAVRIFGALVVDHAGDGRAELLAVGFPGAGELAASAGEVAIRGEVDVEIHAL